MKLAAIGLLVLGALPLIFYPFIFLANVMSFAGTPTGNETTVQWLVSRTFLVGSMIYPIVYILCAIAVVVQIIRNQGKAALKSGSIPVFYLVFIVGVFFLWTQTSRASQNSFGKTGAELGVCVQPVYDGGDGLATSGCGVIENGSASGDLKTTSEAHNWQFTAQNNHQVILSIGNDQKSCPQIHLLDGQGQLVEEFAEENRLRTCLEGMNSTYNYTFSSPLANQVYILRLFAPEAPGAYTVKISY